MNDLFERRVRAAAIAGWWTLAIGVAFLTIVWFIFMAMMAGPPSTIESLWGGMPRDQIYVVVLWLVGIWKLFLWSWAMVATWLTLWARQLRKSVGG